MDLSQSIRNIIEKYGKSIITEDRFVYILQDLYPDRNNPNKFRIISICIKEGINAKIQNLKMKNAVDFINEKSTFISKKFGYNRIEVSDILINLYNGCQKDLSKTFTVKEDNNSNVNPNKGSQNNNTKQQKSYKQQKKTDFLDTINNIILVISYIWLSIPFVVTSKTSMLEDNQWSFVWKLRYEIGWQILYIAILIGLISLIWFFKKNNKNRIFFLILSLWSVYLTPLMYIPALNGDMWPFFNLLIMGIIHISIFSTVYSYLGFYHSPNLVNGGIVSGSLISIGIFIIVGIIFCSEANITKELLICLGNYNHYESPWILTYLILLLYGVICIFAACFLSVELLCNWNIDKVNFSFLLNKGIIYLKWTILTIISFIILVIATCQLPKLYLNQINKKIRENNEVNIKYNEEVKKANEKRLLTNIDFSFDNIKLDGNLNDLINIYSDSIIQIIKKNDENFKLNCYQEKSFLYQYISCCETIVNIKSNWDNEDISIQVLINKGKVGGINVILNNYYHDTDSLINIYSQKYGKPNNQIIVIAEEKTSLLTNEYYLNNVEYNIEEYDNLYESNELKEGIWIYKNGTIHIYQDTHNYRNNSYIEYISDNFIKQYKDFINEEDIKNKAIEQRKQDSIAEVKKLEKIKEQKIQRQREIKHKQSLENI